jgi:hypothetical protein
MHSLMRAHPFCVKEDEQKALSGTLCATATRRVVPEWCQSMRPWLRVHGCTRAVVRVSDVKVDGDIWLTAWLRVFGVQATAAAGREVPRLCAPPPHTPSVLTAASLERSESQLRLTAPGGRNPNPGSTRAAPSVSGMSNQSLWGACSSRWPPRALLQHPSPRVSASSSLERSRASASHRPRELGLAYSTDTSRTNLVIGLDLLSTAAAFQTLSLT